MPLVVVGPYGDDDPYHVRVKAAASDEVIFPGAIFEPDRMQSLRFHSALYLHGHTVGGTNPSLVEAMAAGNAVIAHRNPYNTWVAGLDNAYFEAADDLARLLDELVPDSDRRRRMGEASRARFRSEFTWTKIGGEYEHALRTAQARHTGARPADRRRAGSRRRSATTKTEATGSLPASK
jgi:glycosyltransferase involved in cell wall biosynthesis